MNMVIERASAQATHHHWVDHYLLLRILQAGRTAQVYLAYDAHEQENVVIKIAEHGSPGEKQLAREAGIMSRLDHPYLLPLLDTRRSEQWTYLVTPYIIGGTLADRIDSRTLSPEDTLAIFEQLIEALQYLHTHGIIHRDIKPGNILLQDNQVFLTDFGISTQQNAETMYFDGPMMGTAGYMAPEIYEGEVCRQGDLYALGVVLYEMLTGHLPFLDHDPSNIYWKQKSTLPLPPSLFNPAISSCIEKVVLRMLEPEPQDRFPTANALALAYRKALKPSLQERITDTFARLLQGTAPHHYAPCYGV